MDDWQDAMINEEYIKDIRPISKAGKKTEMKQMTEKISPREGGRVMSVVQE